MSKNITSSTRQLIADEMQLSHHWYHGDLSETDFLSRLYDLKGMHSRDARFRNAYDDIYQHMVNNCDWDHNWYLGDPRFDLRNCDDSVYLKFLAETLLPSVRREPGQVSALLDLYNKHLSSNGYELVRTGEMAGRPIYSGRQKQVGAANSEEKKTTIKRYLDHAYVAGKIDMMSAAVETDTDIAIGTAKELLETICKSILNEREVQVQEDWTLSRLVKETTSVLDFKPVNASDPERAEQGMLQMLRGISSIVHGLAEIRNAYGTGHGKAASFVGLEPRYSRFYVGMVSEIAALFLATNGETTELLDF